MNKDRAAACTYKGSRLNADSVRLTAPTDPGESGSYNPTSHDLRERSLKSPKQLEGKPSPDVALNKVVLAPSSDALVVNYLLRPTPSSPTVLPSIHFQTIPHPLRIPLSVISPDHLRVSHTAGTDLDMSLYVFFSRSRKFHRAGGTEGMFWQPRKGAMSVG